MEFLSVLVEVHNAFWFLFKPELVKLINQITCEENKTQMCKTDLHSLLPRPH